MLKVFQRSDKQHSCHLHYPWRRQTWSFAETLQNLQQSMWHIPKGHSWTLKLYLLETNMTSMQNHKDCFQHISDTQQKHSGIRQNEWVKYNCLHATIIRRLQLHLPGLQSHCILHKCDTPHRTNDLLWLRGQQVPLLDHHPHMRDAPSCHTLSTSWVVQHGPDGSWLRCPGTPHRSAMVLTAMNTEMQWL